MQQNKTEFLEPSSYSSFDSLISGTSISPFSGKKFEYFYLDDFEDVNLNVPGVSVIEAGEGPQRSFVSRYIDSVDGDDGSVDGRSRGTRGSYLSFGDSLTFSFSAAELGGQLPTHAGIVWTDVSRNLQPPGPNQREVFQEAPLPQDLIENTFFEAFGPDGESLGKIGPFSLGDESIVETTLEDRFLGVINAEGISAIKISMPGRNNWEVDHLQYGFLLQGKNLAGGRRNDTLVGGSRNDTLEGGGGNDRLRGKGGNDRLLGGIGKDSLIGDGGNDKVKGNAGNDTLMGGAGADLLQGGTNNDLLIGGAGNDFMLGQQGRDRFRYNNFREGRDTIAGFNALEDRIEISLTGFRRGLTRGVLKSNQFSLGAATQTTHRFLFNNDRLFFDPDGSGARSAVLLAKVTGNDLSRTNIVVV